MRNIPFSYSVLKGQLYETIKVHKKYVTIVVGEIMIANVYMVLRLPSYHPYIHPIELTWAELKAWVDTFNTIYSINDTKHIREQILKDTTEDKWVTLLTYML